MERDKRSKQSGFEYELYECVTWSEETVLTFFSFEGETYASHIRMNGNVSVKADSINHILQGRKVTYIRYDVEGSKLEALKGSIKTIQKYRPKLAILLYHKPEDVAEIPNFLEDLNFNYHY